MELLQYKWLYSQNSSGLNSNKEDNNSFEPINVHAQSTEPIKTHHAYINTLTIKYSGPE